MWSTPKSDISRLVPYPQLLTIALVQRCAGKERDHLAFAEPDGGVLRSGNFWRRQFADAVVSCKDSASDFPALSPPDLRHTAASLAVSAGVNVKIGQRMLGHSSAAMTPDVYADLFEDDLDAVADALDCDSTASDVAELWARREPVRLSQPRKP